MPLFSRRRDVDKLVADAVEKALQPYVANAANHQAGVTQGIPSGQFAVQTVGNQAQVALPRDGSGFDSGFGPGYPLIPDPLDPLGTNGRTPPRRSQYQVAWNLQIQDRQVPWTILKGLAEECDIVNRCIELKQDELCGYEWDWGFSPQIIQQIMTESGETNSARATAIAREKYGDELDRVQKFWEMPDPDMNQNWSDWLQALLWDHFVYDGVAIYPSYNLDGTLRGLELIDSSTIKLLRDNRGRIPRPPAPAYQQILYGFPRGEFQHGEDADDEFRNDQLAYYIKRPRNTSVYGFPVVEETMALSTTYLARQAWMRSEYSTGVTPKMLFKIPPNFNWTPEQMGFHEQAFNDRLMGQIARRQTAFFAPGDPVFAPQVDEHYKQDYDNFLITQIGSKFGVPSSALGVQAKTGLSGGKLLEGEMEQQQIYGSQALINWVVDVVNDLARKYLGIGPEITLVNNGNGSADDELANVQADAADVSAGVITRNEVRAKRGLPLMDLPEMDQPAITTGTGVEFLTGTLQAQEDGQTIAGNMAATGTVPGQPAAPKPPAELNPGQPAADEQDQTAVAPTADAKATPKEQAAKKAERGAYDRFMAKGDPNRRPFMWHYHTPDEVAVIKAETSPNDVKSTERLMAYWSEGEGAAKIGWGKSGDYDRCRAELGKHAPPEDIDGLCANLHHRATGAWPGHAPGESHAKEQLEKVGPEGYIHGWIKVGPGGDTTEVESASSHDAAIAAGAHATRLAARGSGASRDAKIAAHRNAALAHAKAAREALVDHNDMATAEAHLSLSRKAEDRAAKLEDAKLATAKKSADPKAIAWADHPGHKFADAIVAHFAPQIAQALTDGTEGLHAAISTARGVLGKAIAPEPPVVAAPPVATQPNLALVETMQAAQAAVAQAVQIDTTQLAATLTQLYANAGLTGSHAAATVTGGPVLTELASLEATVNWDTWEPGDKVAAGVVRHAGLQQLLADQDATIKGIVDSALDRLSTSLANSIEAGDNMATTAKAMRDVIADPKRAYVIANTETARAMSASSIATYAANGVAEWDWLAEPDACPVCLKNEADSPYDVGEGPTVPAHPNCLIGSTLIVGNARAATNRYYVGDVVTIVTERGHELTGTPNHPIATPEGWVALGRIDVGRDVIRSTGVEWEPSVYPHEYCVIPTIEEVAESFPVTLAVVPTAPEDFHGDGAGSDVHVVLANRLLLDDAEPSTSQHVGQPVLSRGHVAEEPFVGEGALLQRVHFDDSTSRSSISGSDQAFALSRFCPRHASGHRIPTISRGDAVLDQDAADRTSADSEGFCQRLLAFSSDVTTDQVIRVLRSPFAGHVYNLESTDGWYIGNGIITHNCRCAPTPHVELPDQDDNAPNV